jgi:hypothetical protein
MFHFSPEGGSTILLQHCKKFVPNYGPENSNLSELLFYFDISGGSIVQFMEGLVQW